ncbi:hypothetical protein FACS18945_5950 [Bacteroidia bacterium]|nr:hypothetical protein FACS189434_07390 [Bacteroidia bacterium]GHT59764.1 hypothetical protein FACS18945_5950 [Bacteroidia bacterium]
MIQSMTGYGKASCEYQGRKIILEIKSLNSKQFDISTKIVPQYREKELDMRSEIANKLERGKIEFTVSFDNSCGDGGCQINKGVFEAYYNQIKSIAAELSIAQPDNWFDVILRIPDVTKGNAAELDENEWAVVQKALGEALNDVIAFRTQEGRTLEKVFVEKIDNIDNLLTQIPQYEKERIEKIKSRLQENLAALTEKVEYDRNRFEQELIFYIEKLDINEEKVRLQQHLNYFRETMQESNAGKKLGFIAQEIGREINTLGSKANHSEMQKIVVLMKDELEQIKEQVLNVL